MFDISPELKKRYPISSFAMVSMQHLDTTTNREKWEERRDFELEKLTSLSKSYDRKSALENEPLKQYADYYKKFKKTYPILLQLESIVLKGKALPRGEIAIEAMFLAEIKNHYLTAAHDLDKIKGNLKADIANGGEHFQGISGKDQKLLATDMFVSDVEGILSSIQNGPDSRTKVTADTKNVFYFVYGVQGVHVGEIEAHLMDILDYINVGSPNARAGRIEIFSW